MTGNIFTGNIKHGQMLMSLDCGIKPTQTLGEHALGKVLDRSTVESFSDITINKTVLPTGLAQHHVL